MEFFDLQVDGTRVARLLVADTIALRMRGMIARRPVPAAMLLDPASSVHGVGMTRSLDVALLDDEGVVRVVRVLRPFGFVAPRPGVRRVLEAPLGSFARWRLQEGSTVNVVTSPD